MILAVMLLCVDSVVVIKCNGYSFKSSLAEYLDKSNVDWRGSAHWEGM